MRAFPPAPAQDVGIRSGSSSPVRPVRYRGSPWTSRACPPINMKGSRRSPSAVASLAIRSPNSAVPGDPIQHPGEFDIGLDVLEPVLAKPGVQRQRMPPRAREQLECLHIGESRDPRRDILTLELFESLGGFDHDPARWMFDRRWTHRNITDFLFFRREPLSLSLSRSRIAVGSIGSSPGRLSNRTGRGYDSHLRRRGSRLARSGHFAKMPGDRRRHVPAAGRQG